MIESIYIKKTELSPKVDLDKENNKFLIAGKSIIENAHEFYSAILNWFNNYLKDPNNQTETSFYFEYLNSSSFLQVANLIDLITRHSENNNVSIIWYYDKDDDSMFEIGKDLEDTYDTKFDFRELVDESYKNVHFKF